MSPRWTFDQVNQVLDIIRKPLVLEILDCLHKARGLQAGLPPEADQEIVDSAIQFLVHFGAVEVSDDPDPASRFGNLVLTTRGDRVVRALEGF